MHIDENMLAGYISGELCDEERAGVTAALIRDKSLREWIGMAAEALAASKPVGERALMGRFVPTFASSRPRIKSGDRKALVPGARRVG